MVNKINQSVNVKAKKFTPEVTRPLTASPSTLRANFIRLFKGIKPGSRKIGVSHVHVFQMIKTGEVSNYVAGKLYKLNIDPSELVKTVKEPKKGAGA